MGAGVGQPTLGSQPAGNYAQSNSDSRYYNEGSGSSFNATHTSCKDLPNVNEMTWYAAKGDPRWDADELWTTMGHLYKGGMWLKKKSVLQAEHHYNTEFSADGSTDMRTTFKYYVNSNSSITNSGLPSAADANKYFYLLALGAYRDGRLDRVGILGGYWSSSAYPLRSSGAYGLDFKSDYVDVDEYSCRDGLRVSGFE